MKKYFKDVKSEFYLDRYLKFIYFYKNVDVLEDKERHHILPKSLYPEFDKCDWNRVNLPYRAHFIAHWMLAKALGGKMWYAFLGMANKNTKNGRLEKYNSTLYEKAKKEFSKQHSEWHNKETGGIKNKFRIGQATKNKKLEKEGYYTEISKRSAETMKNTVEENGLTIAQNRSIKAAETTKKTGALKGKNNPRTRIIEIYDANDTLKYRFEGNFFQETTKLNLPQRAFKTSYSKNGKPIWQTPCGRTLAKKRGLEKYIGWYAIDLGKCRDLSI